MSKIDELIQRLCPEGVEYRELGDIASVTIGEFVHKNKQNPDGQYPVYNGGRAATGYYDNYNNSGNKIVVSARGAYAGFVNKLTVPYWAGNSSYSIGFDEDNYNWLFAYHILKASEENLKGGQQKGGIPAVSKSQIEKFKIPIPPLEIQREIVDILDKFTQLEAELEAELEARKKQYEFYRNQLLTFDDAGGVQHKTLGEILDYEQPGKYIVKSTEYSPEYHIPVLTAGQSFILGNTNEENGIYCASKESPVMIFDDFTTSSHWVDFNFKIKSSAMKLLTPKDNNDINFRYVYHFIKTIRYEPQDHARQWISRYANFSVPVPPIAEQNRIVAILDKFDALVNDISIGLPAELAARRKQYEHYRNKLLTFPEKEPAHV